MKIGALYVLFAAIATVINILTQETVVQLGQSLFPQFNSGLILLTSSIFMGTLSGLIVKYTLDKKYIFCYQVESKAEDAQKFFLYSLMGIVTTLVFWITEIAFDWYFGTKTMRYLGAVLGLSIGYIVKYQLDKKFVFTER